MGDAKKRLRSVSSHREPRRPASFRESTLPTPNDVASKTKLPALSLSLKKRSIPPPPNPDGRNRRGLSVRHTKKNRKANIHRCTYTLIVLPPNNNENVLFCHFQFFCYSFIFLFIFVWLCVYSVCVCVFFFSLLVCPPGRCTEEYKARKPFPRTVRSPPSHGSRSPSSSTPLTP